jgi:hypothetical protein
MTFSITTLITILSLSHPPNCFDLCLIFCSGKCYYSECCYAECHYAEFHFSERHNTECCYKWRDNSMLNAILLSCITQSSVTLGVISQSVVRLSVVRLSVVLTLSRCANWQQASLFLVTLSALFTPLSNLNANRGQSY